MRATRNLLRFILRLDWAIYLSIVVALLCLFVVHLPAAIASGTTQSENAAPDAVGNLSLGAIYSLLVWVILPITVLVFVNIRASRMFRERIAARPASEAEADIPIVRVRVPADDSLNSP